MNFYVLTSENLEGLGGPMGSERTRDNWNRYFHSEASAKVYAEQDYRKQTAHPKVIAWIYSADGRHCRTQDLGFVMYHVRLARFEDVE